MLADWMLQDRNHAKVCLQCPNLVRPVVLIDDRSHGNRCHKKNEEGENGPSPPGNSPVPQRPHAASSGLINDRS